MVATFCAGFCVSGSQKSVIALSALFYPSELRSTGVGWALGVGRIGGAAGPALVGMMYAGQWQLNHIFYSAAVPIVLAACGIMAMLLYYRGVGLDSPLLAGIDAPV
jgi:AAHS family 4-hydroxybenzoate transporter-like MFS transporter